MQTSLRRQVCWVLTNLLRVRGSARLSDQQRAECAEAFLLLTTSLDPEVQGAEVVVMTVVVHGDDDTCATTMVYSTSGDP